MYGLGTFAEASARSGAWPCGSRCGSTARSCDLLLTCSPAGSGMHHRRFLQPGDVMHCEITGLGVQRNRCVAAG
jgi:hypothetical protein